MTNVDAARVSSAIRGARFPAELSELLSWANYNGADSRTRRELWSLPWREYDNLTDIINEIGAGRSPTGSTGEPS